MKSALTGIRLMSFGIALTALSSGASNTWHVDLANVGKTGLDGISRATAYADIQSAIEADATQPGDTILIWPGDYAPEPLTPSENVRCRVLLNKPRLTFRAAAGKGTVSIVGAHDTTDQATAHGAGPNAVSCVYGTKDASDTEMDVCFEGINFRDGAIYTDTGSNFGGAYCRASGSSASSRTFFVDCMVSNCVCGSGNIAYATCHRCEFVDNYAASSGALRGGFLVNCLLHGNAGSAAVQYAHVINCTCIESVPAASCTAGQQALFNCVVFGSVAKQMSVTNSVITSATGTYHSIDEGVSVTGADVKELLLMPLWAKDYRMLSDSPAAGLGDAKYLAMAPTPPGFVHKDFLGNPIAESGAIQAGCIQSTATPATGLVTFEKKYGTVNADGRDLTEGDWLRAEVWPTQWCFRAATTMTKPLQAINDSFLDAYRFPDMEEKVWIAAPPPETNRVLKVFYADTVRYVNKTTGSDSYDGSSPVPEGGDSLVGPWRTLQHAADSAVNRTTTRIIVAPGVYDEGFASGSDMSNRLSVVSGKHVFFTASGGPSDTVIKGADDPNPDTDTGLGAYAMRCLHCDSSFAGFRGFTLTGGRTRYTGAVRNGTTRAYGTWGAVWYANYRGSSITDCVITGNHGKVSVFYKNCTLERCRIENNTTDGGKGTILQGPSLVSGCVLAHNDGTLLSSESGTAYCTCVGDASSVALTSQSTCCIYNSVVTGYPGFGYGFGLGCLLDGVPHGYAAEGSSFTEAPADLADPANGDYRVTGFSKAAGAADVLSDRIAVARFAATTFDNVPSLAAPGASLAGAYRETMANVVRVVADSGGLKMDGGAPGTRILKDGDTVTVTLDRTGVAPVSGITVNGVFRPFGDDASLTLSAAEARAVGGIRIEPVYATTWYVDPTGSDGNSGFTAEWPKATLVAAMACARKGDTVVAAEGDYAEGAEETAPQVPYRVVVKEGVTLRASGRVAHTRIVGAAATQDTGDDADRGLGTNAVRCVCLKRAAELVGFTLTGGRSWRVEGDDNGGYGAAVWGSDYSRSLVKDCIITDCDAYRYTLGYVSLVNCRIIGNRASLNLSRNCRIAGSLLAKNRCFTVPLLYCICFENSTFAADNMIGNGTSGWSDAVAFEPGQNPKAVVNSILFGKVSATACLTNSVVPIGAVPEGVPACVNVVEADLSEIVLDDEYRPVVGRCVATNAAHYGYVDTSLCGETDFAGMPRRQNGGMDAGCLEADWRGAFAAALGSRAFTVTDASFGTHLTAEGGVSVEEIAFAIDGRPNTDYALAFDMMGSGTLTFYCGDKPVGVFSEGGTFRMTTDAEGKAAFRAVCAGGGEAVLRRARSLSGLMIIVQ